MAVMCLCHSAGPRLVVMSATLAGGLAQDLQHIMGSNQAADSSSTGGTSSSSSQAADSSSNGSSGGSSGSSSVPVVISEGRSYPVTTNYLGKPSKSECIYIYAAVPSCRHADCTVNSPGHQTNSADSYHACCHMTVS
jgi:hypothetical protein